MRLSDSELNLICERASNLSERLSGTYVSTGGDSALAARRLGRWRQLSEQGVEQQLSALTSVSGSEVVSERHLLDLLGSVRRAAGTPLPAWAELLDEIVDYVAQSAASPPNAEEPPKKLGIPFEHLYWPVAEFAWDRVDIDAFGPDAKISIRAKRSLQKHLIQGLSGFASPLLHTTFLAHQAVERSGMLQHLFGHSAQGAGRISNTRKYERFVAEQSREGLRSFLVRFPAAARLLSEVTGSWIESIREFLRRLHHDRHLLANDFHGGVPLGILSDVKAGVSDPHQGGRSVMILRFARGAQIVYKPRPMQIDRAFFELVRKLNDSSANLDLGVLKVIDRRDYGWMEFACHAPCSDGPAARRYYRRAGSLSYLAHWLQGIDFHRENVVAAGEHPILVDLECLAHPLRPEETGQAVDVSAAALGHSVLRTGLLPMWQRRSGGAALYDLCGLNGPVSKRSLLPVRRWVMINTDAMSWVYKTWQHVQRSHRPTLAGQTLSITPFERDVLAGYRKMAAALQDLGTLGIGSLRRAIYEAAARRIKRPTFVYGLVLKQSLNPAVLSEGIDRSIELMSLPCTDTDSDWKAEISSLESLDIPYFRYAEYSKTAPTDAQPVHHASFPADQEDVVRLAVRRQVRLEAGEIRIPGELVGSLVRHPRKTTPDP